MCSLGSVKNTDNYSFKGDLQLFPPLIFLCSFLSAYYLFTSWKARCLYLHRSLTNSVQRRLFCHSRDVLILACSWQLPSITFEMQCSTRSLSLALLLSSSLGKHMNSHGYHWVIPESLNSLSYPCLGSGAEFSVLLRTSSRDIQKESQIDNPKLNLSLPNLLLLLWCLCC